MTARGILGASVLALVLGGCVTDAWVADTYEEELAAWVAANHDRVITKEVMVEVQAIAHAKSEKEAADVRRRLAEKASEAAGHAATGNIIGAALALVGLAGIGYGGYKKMRGSKPGRAA